MKKSISKKDLDNLADEIEAYHEFEDSLQKNTSFQTETPKYLSRKEMLEATRDNRLIADTPLGVHDLIIVEETDGLVAIYLNRRMLEFLNGTKVTTIKTKDDIMYLRDYEEIVDFQKDEKIYEFTDENFQFVVIYTNIRDKILNPIRKYLGSQVLCYSNVRFVFDENSGSLEFELLDKDGEIPIESAIISKKLLQMTQKRHWIQ